jgi:hypothetical protein
MSSISPKSTSHMPSETTWEKPMPRDVAESSTEVAIAPDCATKARWPGFGAMCAKPALRPADGTMTPMQFGPTMRSV